MRRKDFLKIAAGVTAGSFISPSLFAKAYAAPAAVKIKKCLKFGMVKEDLSIMDKFKLVKDLGFDGIELDFPHELNEKKVLKARDATGHVFSWPNRTSRSTGMSHQEIFSLKLNHNFYWIIAMTSQGSDGEQDTFLACVHLNTW